MTGRWDALRDRHLVLRPAELALSQAEIAALFTGAGLMADAQLVTQVHEATAGWAGLVHETIREIAGLASVTLVPPGEVSARLGAALAGYVTQELLAGLAPAALRLLRELSYQDRVCADLVGSRKAAAFEQLVQLGYLRAAAAPPGSSGSSAALAGLWYRPVPLIATVIRSVEPLPGKVLQQLWRGRAKWYEGHRMPGQQAQAWLSAGEPAACAEVLREHGSDTIAAGGAALVVATIRELPAQWRDDDAVRLILGEALTVMGEHDAALAELDTVAETAKENDDVVPAGVAWRQAMVHYQRGDRDAAGTALARGRVAAGGTRDEAMLLAQAAINSWSCGHADVCGEQGMRALQVAVAIGDDRALAAAHVALALHAALAGDRAGNAEHYARGLRHAEAAGDAIQVARIRLNRVSLLLEEARYEEALAAAGPAVAAAQACGHAVIHAVALVNEAEALTRLGRLAEGEDQYQQAISHYQRIGSRLVAYPLVGLGNLRIRRGEPNLARAAFEEAIRVAETDRLQQGLIPALSGLARLLATDDPAAAAELARRALADATGPMVTCALLARGWVALAAGDPSAAEQAAAAAADSARQHRDRAGVAEALELRAASSMDRACALDLLREAERTWRATGSRVDIDRVSVHIARYSGATARERLQARLAQARLDAAGAVVPEGDMASPVVIRALGGFEVHVSGRIVGPSQWQSRKARDLLRILVARRGRPIAREEIGELLWPDDDPARVAHRLSVALSTVRTILDPQRTRAPDHYLAATPGGIGLNLANVSVDVETFLSEAELGLRLAERGADEPAEAHLALSSAAQCYTGDFCQDEPYADWTVQTREEVRAVHLRVIRALAAVSIRIGRLDEAAGHLLRVLNFDPYDERCHRELVDLLTAAGRHGEARRASTRYRAAMAEIGL